MDANTAAWATTATGNLFHLFAEGRFVGAGCRSNLRYPIGATLQTEADLKRRLSTVQAKAAGLEMCARCATAFANLVERDAELVPAKEPVPAGSEATAHFTEVPAPGTRILTPHGPGEVIEGSGVVRDGHPNVGLVWAEVMLDPTAKIPWRSRTRVFLVEMRPEPAATAQDGPCCEHASMYHGARGCDECACSVPRAAMAAHGGGAPAEPTLADEAAAIPVEEPVLGPLETEFMDLLANGTQINNAGRMVGLDAGRTVQLLKAIEHALSADSAWHAVAIFAARRAYSRAAALVSAEGADAHGKLDALVRCNDLHI